MLSNSETPHVIVRTNEKHSVTTTSIMTLVELFDHLIGDVEHVEHVQDLLDALLAHPSTHTKTSEWVRATMTKTYISEVT